MGLTPARNVASGRDAAYPSIMDDGVKTFIADWMADNAPLFSDIMAPEAATPQRPYSAALAAWLGVLDTERRPDA